MIIEKFVMQWTADTKQASTDVETLNKQAEETAGKTHDAVAQLFDNIKALADEGLKGAKASAEEIKEAAKAMEDAKKAPSAPPGGGGVGGGRIGGPGAPPPVPGPPLALPPPPGFVAGGAGAGLGGLAGIAALIVPLAAAAMVATVGKKVVEVGLEQVQKQGEINKDMRRSAWEMGQAPIGAQQAIARGQALGLTREEVIASQTSMFERAKAAANNPYSIEALRYRQAGISVTGPGGGMRTMEDINAQLVKVMNSGKFKSEAAKIAWATEHMGMSFEEASKLATMSASSVNQLNNKVKEQAIRATISQAASELFIQSQKNYDNALNNASMAVNTSLAPSWARLVEKIVEYEPYIVRFGEALGDVAAWFVEATIQTIEFGEGLARAIDSAIDYVLEAFMEMAVSIKGYLVKAIPFLSQGEEKGPGPYSASQGLAEQNEKYKLQAQAERNKGVDELIKKYTDKVMASTQDKTLQNSLIAAITKLAEDNREGNKSLKSVEMLMGSMVKLNSGMAETAKQQAEYSRPPIPVQPVQIGMEQALSLWASGLGKAAGMQGPAAAAEANTRAEYEKFAKYQMQAQLSPTWNPNTLMSPQEALRLQTMYAPSMVQQPEQTNIFHINVKDKGMGMATAADITHQVGRSFNSINNLGAGPVSK